MKIRGYLVVVFFFFCGLILPCVHAEDASVGFSYGTVSKISPIAVTIKEYNYETDDEADVVYIIDSQTEFEGIKSVSEIPAGAGIDIFYQIAGSQKIAKSISLEEDDQGNKPQNSETEGPD